MKALCLNTKRLCPELYVLHKNVNIVHALAAMFYPFEIVDFHKFRNLKGKHHDLKKLA
jgi:hypothetical protein